MAALKVTCSACSARLVLKDQARLGKTLRCPKCSASFVARAAAPELGAPELDDTDSLVALNEAPSPRARVEPTAARSTRNFATDETQFSPQERRRTTARRPSRRAGILFAGAALVLIGIAAVFFGQRPTPPEPVSPTPVPMEVAATPDPEVPAHRSPPRAPMSVPDWLIAEAPFDVRSFWITVPDNENAAPLYLDALYEFEAGMEVYSPPEVRTVQSPVIRKRSGGVVGMPFIWATPTPKLPAERDAYLKEYELGFQKLAQAQRRPRCQFELGWAIADYAPLEPACREVARVSYDQVERDLEAGHFDAVVARIGLLLRLSRDLRPRAPYVMQSLANHLDAWTLHRLLVTALRSPRLPARNCRELQELLALHVQELKRINPYLTGLRADYLRRRLLLHDLEHSSGEFAEDRFRQAFGSTNATRGAALMAYLADKRGGSVIRSMFDSVLTTVQPKHYAASAAWERDRYREQAAMDQQPFAAHLAAADAFRAPKTRFYVAMGLNDAARSGLKDDALLDQFQKNLSQKLAEGLDVPLPSIILPQGRFATGELQSEGPAGEFASRARLPGLQALVALRYWYATHSDPPPGLDEVCRHAGLPAAPLDPFDVQPFRMVTFAAETPIAHRDKTDLKAAAGEIVVYSVGPDRVDDRAARDFGSSRYPGDFLFRLEAPQSAFPPAPMSR